jgi:hypothetical protein
MCASRRVAAPGPLGVNFTESLFFRAHGSIQPPLRGWYPDPGMILIHDIVFVVRSGISYQVSCRMHRAHETDPTSHVEVELVDNAVLVPEIVRLRHLKCQSEAHQGQARDRDRL